MKLMSPLVSSTAHLISSMEPISLSRSAMGNAVAAVARRFLSAYQLCGGTVPDQQIDRYMSLLAFRIRVELDSWREQPARSDSAHPWPALSPVAVEILSRTTIATLGTLGPAFSLVSRKR
jgi:hypothetical protein